MRPVCIGKRRRHDGAEIRGEKSENGRKSGNVNDWLSIGNPPFATEINLYVCFYHSETYSFLYWRTLGTKVVAEMIER